ncbi:NACHT nucleoside triphosphatase [Penicillium angulare]|uniref:NACHT nucleoside triphosphatase n=1 Tax=Penicillium angulare TaxID=116970 RepID=A0A9W9FTN7_9EURO|nr:NACHT nucleoside triphosphatase [Penicillium angulare]
MALVISTVSRLKPEVRLAQAISVFIADLSNDQKARFNARRTQALSVAPSVQDVRTFTAEIDRSHGGRCLGPRFINLIEAVQKFASLGDIIIGGSQNIIACGVWSAVRLSLSPTTVKDYTKFPSGIYSLELARSV